MQIGSYALVVFSKKFQIAVCLMAMLAAAPAAPAFAADETASAVSTLPIMADDMATGSVELAPAPPMAPPVHTPTKKHVIVLDPGHGGMDPGAISSGGTKEKDVVLAFANTLREALETNGRYEVLLTRSADSFVKLDDRVKFARDHDAELFIALHADTLEEPDTRGSTLYTISDKASDAEAERLAQKENGVDKVVGLNISSQKPDVANALMNLAQRESRSEALLFAQKALHEVKPLGQLTRNPLRSASFVVLKAPDVPSILFELGYLSNDADEALLTSNKWRKDMSEAMTKAVDSYFNTASARAAP